MGLYDKDLRQEPSWRIEHARLLAEQQQQQQQHGVPIWGTFGSSRSGRSMGLEPIAEIEDNEILELHHRRREEQNWLWTFIRTKALGMKLPLTEAEARIFATLQDALENLGMHTTLRVAGGWIRDKMLGLESHDIDIAIDDVNMTGKAFCEKIEDYLMDTKAATRPSKEIGKNGAAMLRIYGLDVDFVKLKTNGNVKNVRPPLEEDAYLRDLTINSLFYNINSGCIEDFTGRGLTDLQAGLISTPEPPLETLRYDSFRVLRFVRFACRLDFEIDPKLMAAASKQEIKSLFRRLDPNRIGNEMKAIIFGKNFGRGMRLLGKLGYLEIIFGKDLPDGWDVRGIEYMQAAFDLVDDLGFKDDERMRNMVGLAALLLPLKDRLHPTAAANIRLAQHIAGSRLFFKDDRIIGLLHEDVGNLGMNRWIELMDDPQLQKNWRVQAGLLVRNLKCLEAYVMLVCVYKFGDRRERVAMYMAIRDAISMSFKPLVEGSNLIKDLKIPKGPEVGMWVERAFLWQLDNPEASQEDCLHWIADKRTRLQ